jgi:hypothetical protein
MNSGHKNSYRGNPNAKCSVALDKVRAYYNNNCQHDFDQDSLSKLASLARKVLKENDETGAMKHEACFFVINAAQKLEAWDMQEEFAKAALRAVREKNSKKEAYAYSALHTAYKMQEKWPELEALGEERVEFGKKHNLINDLAHGYGALNQSFSRQEKWGKLEAFSREALEFGTTHHRTEDILYAYAALTFALQKQEKWPDMRDVAKERVAFAIANNLPQEEIDSARDVLAMAIDNIGGNARKETETPAADWMSEIKNQRRGKGLPDFP